MPLQWPLHLQTENSAVIFGDKKVIAQELI